MHAVRFMPSEAELNRIAGEIIAGAIAVHRAVGPGCFESAYAPCLAYELHQRRLDFRAQVPIAIHYETLTIPRAYEADFIIENSVVVELKATKALGPVMRGSCSPTCVSGAVRSDCC